MQAVDVIHGGLNAQVMMTAEQATKHLPAFSMDILASLVLSFVSRPL